MSEFLTIAATLLWSAFFMVPAVVFLGHALFPDSYERSAFSRFLNFKAALVCLLLTGLTGIKYWERAKEIERYRRAREEWQ